MRTMIDAPAFNMAYSVSHEACEQYLIHFHPSYELYYFLSGDTHFLYDGIEYTMQPHTLVIVAPNVYHGLQVHTKETYARYTLHFDRNILPERCKRLFLRDLPTAESVHARTTPIPLINPCVESWGLVRMMEEFLLLRHQSEDIQNAWGAIMIESILIRILTHIDRDCPNSLMPASNGAQKEIDRVLSYIHQHITERLSLDTLSKNLFISKSRLAGLFRQELGMTVSKYVVMRRLSYAQQLLINGFSASQAGELAGFGDYTSFYRAYVKHMGHTPGSDKRNVPMADQNGWFGGSAIKNVSGIAPLFSHGDSELDVWINTHTSEP